MCETITHGRLNVRLPDGSRETFGVDDGGIEADFHLHDWSAISAIIARGDVGFGEAYSDGLWDSGNVQGLLRLILNNDSLHDANEAGSWMNKIGFMLRDRIVRRNSVKGARSNIQVHYDVGNEFYRLWLDETMTYSSGLFDADDQSLSGAQTRKYDRLLSLLGERSERILEVGCGWGGFAARASEMGHHVTGITISPAQHDYAQKRLSGTSADILLRDYRAVEGKFDSIVSIEMIEAVGLKYWPQYFKMLKDRLSDGGRIALQAIIIEDNYFDNYKNQSDYIRQYTFPGGMLVSPQSIITQAERAGLSAAAPFRFGQDYAHTLRHWLSRFTQQETHIRKLGYDDAFIRSWRYYLNACAAGFAVDKQTNVVHVELKHSGT